jgi:hypothetical protein
MDDRGRKSQRRLRHAAAGAVATPATTRSKTAEDQGARDKRADCPEELIEGTI